MGTQSMTDNLARVPAFNRRSLLHRAVAGVVGAAIGASALPVAAAVSDPLPAMVDEYFRLNDAQNNAPSQEAGDLAFGQQDALVQRIVDTVAPTAAGILAQLRLLSEMAEIGTEWIDDRDIRLIDSMAAGLRALSAGGAA
jgi:hypothetical protein